MQREEKQLEVTIEAMIQKLQELKSSITSFLIKLQTEHANLNWLSVLDSFAVISSQLNSFTRLLKGDKTPLLRNQVFLPLTLSPDRDPELEKLTEGRVMAFNHEVVPDYLRTKPEPEAEERSQQINTKATAMSADAVQKHIQALNKITNNLTDMIQMNREEWESELNQKTQQPQFTSQTDSNTIISAITFGKGLRNQQAGGPSTSGQNGSVAQDSRTPTTSAGTKGVTSSSSTLTTKVPSTIRTNIKSASTSHPYSRP